MTTPLVLEMLRANLPADGLITDPKAIKPYESDGLTAFSAMPWVVCLPDRESQVSALLRICHEHDIPVVTRGAGTGLSGGALPVAEGVLLVLSRLKRIKRIDSANLIAVVEPGVRNLAVSEAAESAGLFYAPDPSSQIACSIGGNVAENAGGVHCLKYGLTVHNVIGVRGFLMTGEAVAIGGEAFDLPGADLLAVVHGSEGQMIVITEITLRLRQLPRSKLVMMAAFSEVSNAAQAVADVISAGIIPAGMEMMDKLAVSAAEDFVGAGYPRDAAAILLIELDGDVDEVVANRMAVERVVLAAGAVSVVVAEDEAAQARLWLGRKAAFPAVGRIAPDYYCMDGTIPRKAVAGVLDRIGQLSQRYGLQVANVFHAGDGNLHPLILYDANVDGELAQAEAFGNDILAACVEAGGSVTGEHGVGVEKLDAMCGQFGRVELEQFYRLRQAFDPAGLLNPGKAIPTLTRCSEVGGMHVHAGELPFRNLPRF